MNGQVQTECVQLNCIAMRYAFIEKYAAHKGSPPAAAVSSLKRELRDSSTGTLDDPRRLEFICPNRLSIFLFPLISDSIGTFYSRFVRYHRA